MIPKYYSEKQIYAATFFGGPIPAGILIYKNFKRIEADKKAILTLLFTFAFTFLLFYGLMQLPETISDKIPNILFTSLYTVIVYFIYHKYSADDINSRIIEEENKVSNWNVAGITLFGLLINLIIIFTIAFNQPMFPGEKMTFGQLNHEVFFDKENTSTAEIQKTGEILTEFGFFQDEYQMSVRIEKQLGKLLLKIPIQKEFWNDADFLSELFLLKNNFKQRLNQEVVIVLIHYELNGDTLTKNI